MSQPHKFYTNKVLFLRGQKEDTYYLPAYLRIKVKNFTEMNLQSLDAQMNATLIFTVFYGNLEDDIFNEIENGIVFLFNRDDALKLEEGLEIKPKKNANQKTFSFTIRRLLKLRIEADVFWSPFEIIDLVLTITLQSIDIKRPGKKKTVCKFNLMDHPNNFLKCSYSEEGTFGNYDLAESRLTAEFTNDRVPLKLRRNIAKKKPEKNLDNDLESPTKLESSKKGFNQQENIPTKQIEKGMFELAAKTPKHFQYAHFTIPLYKFPAVTVATIFLPLWLLGIINLGIFFQDNTLADRIASIAALMIAFVALIPTIRTQIPPNPSITFVEVLVYIETLTSFLCLIHSLMVRNNEEISTTFLWYQEPLFLISAIITAMTIVCVVVLYLFHKCVWEPSYNRNVEDEKDAKFLPWEWYNEECNMEFRRFHKIQIFTDCVKPPKKEAKDGKQAGDRVQMMKKQTME